MDWNKALNSGGLTLDAPQSSGGLTAPAGSAPLSSITFGQPYGDGGSNVPAPDPYAQWGGQTKYNNLLAGYGTQQNNVYDTAQDAAKNYGLGYGNNILDFIDSLTLQQNQVNNKGVQAEMAKNQGTQGIQDMVGRGIRSGGTMLANRNASDSSAGEAIARAYGDVGNRELQKVGNQYGQSQNDISQMQDQLGVSTRLGLRKFETEKLQTVNSIVMDARNKLAQIEAQMQEASLPEQIELKAAQDRVRSGALSALQGYDQQLASGVAGVKATDTDARRLEAARLGGLGTAVENPFNFSTETPAQLQNSGASAPGLPLFTIPRREEV